jgi:hypothetical protein
LGRRELKALVTQDLIQDIPTKINAVLAFHKCGAYKFESEEQKQATTKLVQLLQRSDLTLEQNIDVARALSYSSAVSSEERRQSIQRLGELLHRPDLTLEQSIEVARTLSYRFAPNSEEQQQAIQKLTELLHRPDLTIQQMVKVARSLYSGSYFQSEEQQQGAQELVKLSLRSDLTCEQAILIAQALNEARPEINETYLMVQRLVELVQQPNTHLEQIIQVARAFCGEPSNSYLYVRHREAARLVMWSLVEATQRANLTLGQSTQIGQVLARYIQINQYLEDERWVPRTLTQLLEQTKLDLVRIVQVASILYYCGLKDSEEKRQATKWLARLLERSDLTLEQSIEVTRALYRCSAKDSEEEQQATQRLWHLAQKSDIPMFLRLQIASIPLSETVKNYQNKDHAIKLILGMVDGKAAKHYIEEKWQPIVKRGSIPSAEISDIPFIIEIAKEEMLPTKIKDEMYQILNNMVPKFDEID